jgi:hypothetical protein
MLCKEVGERVGGGCEDALDGLGGYRAISQADRALLVDDEPPVNLPRRQRPAEKKV